MEKDSVGIKSLHNRLSKLEKTHGGTTPNNTLSIHHIDFIEKMKSIEINQHQKEEEQKVLELENIRSIYKSGLEENKIEPSISNLPKIVEYSVQFVERFFLVISKILDVVLTNKNDRSLFKIQSCINFITEFIDTDGDLIKNLINQTVDLLFNRKKYEEKIDSEKLKRKGKKNGSLRKISKILTCSK